VSRRPGDFALVGLAATVTLAPDGACAGARLVFCGAGRGPGGAARAAGELTGRPIAGATLARAAAAAAEELSPDSDIHASAEYRRRVAGTLVRRAVPLAAARAGGAAA
jgi:carbon-monoxide dehydrogenase medium subunit